MTTKGLWRIAFEIPAAPALPILDALEERALSVSVFEIEADDQQETTRWRVELLEEVEPANAVAQKEIATLLKPTGLELQAFTFEFLPHENWLEKAAMPRPPQRIGRFYVHGQNDPEPAPAGSTSLAIDVGMAFGSGEHGSTLGCLLAFDRLLQLKRFHNILDLGCGSAILGIAAARTARCRVIAADNDPLAVEIARKNASINKVGTRVTCIVSDGYTNPQLRRRAPFDLIFANILADPLRGLAPALRRNIARGGYAILAGLLDRQAGLVIDAHRDQGLRLSSCLDLKPWTTLVLKRMG